MADKDKSDEERRLDGAEGENDEYFDASNIEDEEERSERQEVRRKLEEVGVKWSSKWSTVEARRRLQKRLDAINAESGATGAAPEVPTLTPQPNMTGSTPLTIEMMFAAMMQAQVEGRQRQAEDRKVLTNLIESLCTPATNEDVRNVRAQSGGVNVRPNHGILNSRSDTQNHKNYLVGQFSVMRKTL